MIYPKDVEQKLGFDQIRQSLKNYCVSSLGSQVVDDLRFLSDYKRIVVLLEQNLEFSQILEKGEAFPSTNYFDPRELYPVIAIEDSFIEEESFHKISLSLQTIFDSLNFLDKSKEFYPRLFALSELVTLDKRLVTHIRAAIDDDGNVKDSASVELARIRRKLREERSRARRIVEQIFRQASDQGFVPEGVSPTIRDGHVVLPLLAEHKRKIKGFILDESSTGQTVYIEPAEAMEVNNEIRDLELAERREIVKVLKELTKLLRIQLPALKDAFEFLGQMDFIRAKAKFSRSIEATLPQLKEKPDLNWMHARHPLLFLSLKGKRPVVPLTIDLTDKDPLLLISGPNAGGKSVCLKTVGLIQYMVQCGLLVPLHDKSTVGIFKNIFLDIGDQQSIENDLSTYSSHLRNMRFFIENASSETLVLMDELGSGTDPNFGGGIAQAVLASLVKKGVWGVATTHYYNLKLFADQTPGLKNGAMLFDSQRLEPLFMLEIGKPGSSFALEIARKTGLPSSTIHEAENIIGKDLTGLESLMKTVADEKQQVNEREKLLRQKEKEVTEALKKYQHLAQELEVKKKDIINTAKSEASLILKETNREIEKTIRHIRENKAEKKETRKVRQGLEEIVQKVKPTEEKNKFTERGVVKEGDKVRLIGQEVTGTVLSLKDNLAVVQFGDIRSTVKADRLVRSDLVAKKDDSFSRVRSTGINLLEKQSNFSSTLDVRGKRVEEVAFLVEQFLDDAILLGQGELKILHGKGEGVLRKVIREQLKKVKQVASFKDEHVDRGGAGITVVVLK
ncbi:MAG TPA: Smr/MutS family protein [Cyclobacteriaceae bacterium]|nr:Smr/MutS family protein [Cyclobacteriaceae bacterium]